MPDYSPSDQYVAVYVIEFTDDGLAEVQVIHRGSMEECERVHQLLPGIAYKGSRPIKGAYQATFTAAEWDR